jgi:hypothetical protein
MVCEKKGPNGDKICKMYWCGDGSHYCDQCNSDRSKGNCVQCNVQNNMKHWGIDQAEVPPDDSHCLGVPLTDPTCVDPKAPFRRIPAFVNRRVKSFLAHSNQGSLVMCNDGSENLYEHTLPDGSKAQGLLHFYPKPQTGSSLGTKEFVFLSESEYEQQKDSLPPLCFAIKCPIANL